MLDRMTVAEFLAWDSGDGARYQLADGYPEMMAPPSWTHGAIQAELGALLRNHLLPTKCVVVVNPGVITHVDAAHNFRIPDLAVTCTPADDRHEVRDPVLIVEILSPGNERATRDNVHRFLQLSSVREVLLVHSTRIAAELFVRDRADGWPAEPVLLGPGDTLHLASIDYTVPLTALYRTTAIRP